MINLRYHIVSITAVFLALGIGITMGSSFLGRTALDQIDRNVEQARREVRDSRTENARLRQEVSRFEQLNQDLTNEGAEQIFAGRLEDMSVLVIAASGVDKDSLDDLRTALRGSGAALDGTLVVTDKLALEGADADELASLLEEEDPVPEVLRSEVARLVAAELTTAATPARPPNRTTTSTSSTSPGPPGTGVTTTERPTTTTEPDPADGRLLTRDLVDEAFLDYQPAADGAGSEDLLLARDYRYVVVTGPEPDPADSVFLQPLLQAMTEDGPARVVVASAATGDDPEAVREVALAGFKADDGVRERISTVNNLEDFSGIAAVILALEDIDASRYGHYGLGGDVQSLLPTDEGG